MNITYLISQIAITLTYVFLVLSYQTKNRHKIIIFNLTGIGFEAISHILLGAYTGVAAELIAIIRNIFFITMKDKKDTLVFVATCIVTIILAIITYSGFLSLMPIISTLIYTYSIWQKNNRVYRLLGIPVSSLWLGYNIYIKSAFGIILETILLLSIIYSIIKKETEIKKVHYAKN